MLLVNMATDNLIKRKIRGRHYHNDSDKEHSRDVPIKPLNKLHRVLFSALSGEQVDSKVSFYFFIPKLTIFSFWLLRNKLKVNTR